MNSSTIQLKCKGCSTRCSINCDTTVGSCGTRAGCRCGGCCDTGTYRYIHGLWSRCTTRSQISNNYGVITGCNIAKGKWQCSLYSRIRIQFECVRSGTRCRRNSYTSIINSGASCRRSTNRCCKLSCRSNSYRDTDITNTRCIPNNYCVRTCRQTVEHIAALPVGSVNGVLIRCGTARRSSDGYYTICISTRSCAWCSRSSKSRSAINTHRVSTKNFYRWIIKLFINGTNNIVCNSAGWRTNIRK